MQESSESGEALGEEREELPADTVFAILKNPRRRYAIRSLERLGGESTVRELTAEVAATENDVEVEQLRYRQRKRVYTSLYQVHLPKLDEAGVVDYDERSGEVALADGVDACRPHLDVIAVENTDRRDLAWTATEAPWRTAAFGIAAANLLVAGIWILQGPQIWSLPAAVAMGGFDALTAVVLATLAQHLPAE